MTTLTDELLRRRLADRAAAAPASSLAAIARSVAAQPRRRPWFEGARGLLLAPIVAGLVVLVALAGGLLTGDHTSPGASGQATSGLTGSASVSGLPIGPAPVPWAALTWEETSAEAFASDRTIIADAIAVGDGFVAVGTSTNEGVRAAHVWRSGDGRSWQRDDDLPFAALDPNRIMTLDGSLIVLGYAADAAGDATEPAQVWSSVGGRTWTRGPDLPNGADIVDAAAGPSGILLAAGRHSFVLEPDLSAWTQTTTWPDDLLLGAAAWADGRWIQPGTIGADPNGVPSRAAVWTSIDARTWSSADVEQPSGGMFQVRRIDAGLVGIGTGDDVCSTCRGLLAPRSTVAWGSTDGATWRRLAWDGAVLPRGFQTRVASDARRIIVSGSMGFGRLQDRAFNVFETVDGTTLTPIAGRGDEPDQQASYGLVVIGSSGLVLLPLSPFDGSAGPLQPHIWWGEPTAPPSGEPAVSPSPASSAESSPSVTGCADLGFGEMRCRAVVARANDLAGQPAGVVSVQVRRFVGSDTSLGSYPIATVDLTLGDGTNRVIDIRCGLGRASDRVCSPDPLIEIGGGVSTDVPCGATPGDENHPCATKPPRPRDATIAASTPLILRTFDVVLDHVGHYEVLVGHASLPDGLLSERSGVLADPRPTTWWIDTGVQIAVRPGDPCIGSRCQSVESIYHEPLHGPQPVNVYLVFDVVELDAPGAILEVRNLIVR